MASTTSTKKAPVHQVEKPVRKAEKPVVKKVNKSASAMKEVLAVASEIYPLIKTGGLADVVGALGISRAMPARSASIKSPLSAKAIAPMS